MAAADCLFCRIVRGEIPSRKVYEDADMLAFNDIHPLAPVHFMIIPKQHIASLADVDASHQGSSARSSLPRRALRASRARPRLPGDHQHGTCGPAGGVSFARPCHRRPEPLGPMLKRN